MRIIQDHKGEAAARRLRRVWKDAPFPTISLWGRENWVPPKAATRFARFRSASGTAGATADRCEAETHDLSAASAALAVDGCQRSDRDAQGAHNARVQESWQENW